MASVFARGRRRVHAFASATAFAAATLVAFAASAADTIVVRLDQARIERMPQNVATLVVGNPLIADISLQMGGLMVVTGKGYGTTNLLALDRNGNMLAERLIEVQGPSGDGVVIVHRGADRESYSCTPNCERRITLGDSPAYFETTIGQTGTRNLRAVGSAGPASGGAGSRSTNTGNPSPGTPEPLGR
jgi:hypothetical protein